MNRHLLSAVLLAAMVACLGGSPTLASEAKWRAAVQKSRCFDTPVGREGLILIAAGWRGSSVAEIGTLSRVAGFDETLSTRGFDGFSPAVQTTIADRFLTAAARDAEQLERDIAAHGAALCPLLHAQAASILSAVAAAQKEVRSPSHPYLAVAQYALMAQGCELGDVDGAFGARSRAAWTSAATVLGWPPAARARVPTAGDVALLLRQPFRRNVCASDVVEANALPVARLAALTFAPPGRNCSAETRHEEIRAILPFILAPNVLLAAQAVARNASIDGHCYIAGQALFHAYIGARERHLNRADAARAHLVELGYWKPRPAARNADQDGPTWDADALVTTTFRGLHGEIGVIIRLSELVARFDDAHALVRGEATAQGLFAIATVLLEGHSEAGQQIARGVELMAEAARGGENLARLRVAQFYEQGYGVARDLPKALAAYEQLAASGQIAGFLALARLNESGEGPNINPAAAARWYRAMFAALKTGARPDAADNEHPRAGIGKAIGAQLIAGSVFLASEQGRALLLDAAKSIPDIATSIAEAYGCVECGGAIDVEKSAEWYRVAHDAKNDEAGYKLARLLLANPKLEKTPNEARTRLRAAAEGSMTAARGLELYLDAAGAGRPPADIARELATRLRNDLCQEEKDTRCLEFMHQIAIGGIDERLVKVGFDFLQAAAKAALTAPKNPDGDDHYSFDAINAYVDVLAFYGDFDAARTTLAASTLRYYDRDDYSARNAVLRRLVANRGFDRTKGPSPLTSFLQLAATRGDKSAVAFLDLLATDLVPPTAGADAPDLARSAALYQQQLARGGSSRGLATAARSLAEAEARADNRPRAITLELAALNTELELEKIEAIWSGPLPAALARVCLYSKASRRIFDFGNADLAIVLAKIAVNELQELRMKLRELPQQLQLCFRDMIADHYRWLADLFIRQGRTAEAERVLGFLKDFETFQFLDRDDRFRGAAFDRLPLTAEERRAEQTINQITVPVASLAARERELRMKRAQGPLTAAEERELADIARTLQAHAEQTAALMRELLAAAQAGRTDNDERMRLLNSIRGRLRNEFKREAIALHYVVLPDRMHAILTMTGGPQLSHTWNTLDGAPFTEAALDAKIARFRAQLQTPSSDPLPLARELHALLIAPFAAEISASGAKTLLLSLDRKLRYLPFAALHDGTSYLVENRRIVMMTEAIASLAPASASRPVSALATTRAFPGFPALKGAGLEVTSLVQGAAGYGLLDGRAILDDRFTRKSLGDSLLFGQPGRASLGIVHIASHFKVGRTESESFLLLGNGDRLSVRDIKVGMGAEFDFGDVELLALSACDTAYAERGADGRELESFATAAQRQGSRVVLASLWPISDASTAVLMLRFYELSVNERLPHEAALAKVQHEFIRGRIGASPQLAETARRGAIPLTESDEGPGIRRMDGFSHPFYWAPFVLMQGLRGG